MVDLVATMEGIGRRSGKDSGGNLLLMALRIRDYPVETVKYLVDDKVEWLDGKDTDGNGPLHLAVLTESLDLCRLITQYVPRRSLSCEIKRARRPSSWLPKLASPTSSFTCPP